ncbi:hypothetical protein L218DRAFT_959320 [Marasmius fiardii PR-910]|nr:hypothetical protein L218DRAFT_959320 [Marasmius fiardii PR-910]
MLPLRPLIIIDLLLSQTLAWINYPANGFASLTHYELPQDWVPACGCTRKSNHYPTAALSQMAYGSSQAYGSSCGRCFRLTLLNSVTAVPTFYPPVQKSVVIKVTDLCPLSTAGWCNGTENEDNKAGHNMNFDLSYPSPSIPSGFFPSNVSFYGYEDFGVWNISYESVPCSDWAGSRDAGALGSTPELGPESACCPANPTMLICAQGSPNDTCPSYSDKNGIPPDTRTSSAEMIYIPQLGALFGALIFSGSVSWLP